jgi:hypothetical protein
MAVEQMLSALGQALLTLQVSEALNGEEKDGEQEAG